MKQKYYQMLLVACGILSMWFLFYSNKNYYNLIETGGVKKPQNSSTSPSNHCSQCSSLESHPIFPSPSTPKFTPECPSASGTYNHGIGDRMPQNLTDPELMNLPEVSFGGHWSPKDCVPTHGRTLLIVVLRNRKNHLSLFLSRMHPFLRMQRIPYSILVVNQLGQEPFNRGTLFNIGYFSSRNLGFECFVLSDVDMVPDLYDNSYTCNPKLPRHLSSAVSHFNYKLPYAANFGGIVAFTGEQFEKINGFSNFYWGWGGEDDDLYKRTTKVFGSIDRPSESIGRIKHFPHTANESAPKNPDRVKILWAKKNSTNDGLNSFSEYCQVVNDQKFNLYTQINVKCNPPNGSVILSKL